MDAQENQVYTSILVACFVIGSIIAYFIYSAIRHQKKVLAIERKNARAEIAVLEKDRARIAADLHDDLAPLLSAIRMRINSFDLQHANDRQQREKTNRNIDDMATRMRAIAFDLMPASLLQKGLCTAVSELVGLFSKKEGLAIKLALPVNCPPVDNQTSIHLYRIIQEIIHNTIKHARASELLIVLEETKNTLVITTQDNGIGFDLRKTQRTGTGLGLGSLSTRANLLAGELTTETAPGKGTLHRIEIPLT